MKEANELEHLLHESRERLKELAAINKTTSIIKENKPVADTLQHICLILPNAMQYPEQAVARIQYADMSCQTQRFEPTEWNLIQEFSSIDNIKGKIEISYTHAFPEADEGPFLKEERNLILNISSLLTGYINSLKAKQIYQQYKTPDRDNELLEEGMEPGKAGMRLLQKYLYRQNYDRDIFHDLMPFKVSEILLISTLYDAYSIEKEGRFAEHVLGEYQQLNLSSFPRIIGVSTEEEAFSQLQKRHFDLIIYMVGADTLMPFSISAKIKDEYPYIPIYYLINNNTFPKTLQKNLDFSGSGPDKIFHWNGEPSVFSAMVKHLEDRVNVDNDTRMGLVRVILLVEDDPRYYSRYMPLLHSIVLEQTRRIIDDVATDELYKVLKLRGRPKILLANNFEEAIELFDRYKEFMLCLITDVKYARKGKEDQEAGFELVKKVRAEVKDLPIIIQSSEIVNAQRAFELKSTFVDKNSETLSADIRSFISHYLGFGNFVYRAPDGREIAVARTLKEFENHLRNIPDDSLLFHAKRNHFSLWLMARGEIQVAKILGTKSVDEFNNTDDIRNYLLQIIQRHRNEKNKGKVVAFEDVDYFEEGNILSLGAGSYGGKGRGVSFINSLIYNFDFASIIPDIHIKAPRTALIGVEEFEIFMNKNQLWEFALAESYRSIMERFMESRLSDGLTKKLKRLLRMINKPIAVRSSGLFEDSMRQPFAGIFETYLLPNSHPDFDTRFEQLSNAIKLVYASVFSDIAKGYIEAVNYKIEEEKMAIVIQEVVGNQFEHYYYPHISGAAQSYNYYPVAHMTPEEGVAVAAVGLGKYVVEGEKAYRFSPVYPDTEISSQTDLIKNTQVDFFAVDLKKHNIDLLEGDTAGLVKLDIWEAEKHGNLKHCASVYDAQNNTIEAGIDKTGPRVINFANILKYNYIPMAKTIKMILDIVKESMGSPVEIEYAIDINRDRNGKASFYLLQIKPILGSTEDFEIDTKQLKEQNVLLFAERSMGNGRLSGLRDVIFAKKASFDKTRTMEMANEIDSLNRKMMNAGTKYILIGPGRWGSRDRFIGIPVTWPQISYAQVIVETSLEDFPLDASMGSHFFHNITSLGIGYFSVQYNYGNSRINWEMLEKQEIIDETEFFVHIRFKEKLDVRMDGKKRISVISIHDNYLNA